MCKNFGEPDGARTNIEDLSNDDYFYINKNVSNESYLRTRIIVGSKGSGKTVYLRRMYSRLRNDHSVCVTKIQQEMPPTDFIIRFGQMFDSRSVTEAWSTVWRIAILRSLISNLLKNKEYNQNLNQDIVEMLKEYEGEFFPEYRVPRSIYTELKDLLQPNFFASSKHFYDFAYAPEWDDIMELVSELLYDRKPVYFFVDSIDDEYAHAPMYWMQCQKGLFYRVMRFVRENVYGNKLHVVICVRDNVLASVYRSEHRSRYLDSDHIKILRWGYRDIENFLIQKVRLLDSSLFTDPEGEHSLQNWLGISVIENKSRKINEEIASYIIRHTRKLPRDIIVLGNELIKMKENLNLRPKSDLNESIRETVGNCARFMGDELITVCANQIMNNEMPGDAGKNQYTEVYTSSKEFRRSISTDIYSVLRSLKDERLTWQEIIELDQLADQKIFLNCHLSDTLWQNGALGYININADQEEEIFFDFDYNYFLLPHGKESYILRSLMVDAIPIHRTDWDIKPIMGGTEHAV